MPRRIPASVTSAYNRAVKAQGDAAERAVRQALGEFFRENPTATAEEAREYAIQLLQGAGDLYGAAASQAAYDLLQNVAYVDGMPMPDLGSWFYEADAEAIDRTAHYHAGKLADGDVQGFIDQISAAARECAERGANETMSQAAQAQARRDGRSGKKGGRRRGARTYGIHFARVPMGPTTCPFCLMLASRGFVYLSEESAGEFDRFHRHCDCRIVPGTADTKVDGYDPAELYDRWKHPEKYAEESAPTTREQLEQEARRAYIANGGGMGLSAEEAAERFDLLVNGNTDAQLRGYIKKHGNGGSSADLRVESPYFVNKMKGESKNYWTVDYQKVETKTYREKYEKMPYSSPVNDKLHKEAIEMLNERDGTNKERLVALNARTGKRVASNYMDEPHEGWAQFNEAEESKIRGCKDGVVLLHNHPNSTYPSAADIISCCGRHAAGSAVACHDGDVFLITVDPKFFPEEGERSEIAIRFDELVEVAKRYNSDDKEVRNIALRMLEEENVNKRWYQITKY